MSLAQVLKVNIYLVNMEDFAAVNEAYREFFPEGYPARSCVVVKELVLGGKIEIEVIASIK